MVSSPDFANSLTVSGAASAHYTLKVISIVVAICLPVILVYTGWTYHVFRQRLGGDEPEPGPPTPDPPGVESDGLGRIVRALDSQLLARARAARRLLALDVAAGVATALVVLLQAFLLARIVAGAFHGLPPAALWTDVLLLALAFAARGALAWSFEVAGRRAAQSVLSELRLDLVEGRLRGQPSSADGAEEGEIVAAAVQGVDGLEAYFARYLPQLVLACVVPVAVLAFVAAIDLRSALVMLATLPLVPVFMWLIGRYTEERTRERWLALRLLSTHFLDVVRGLPTLRAFNRARGEAATLADVGERYRRATMGTLRVAFLSGSVLELAATLGVALVAVTVGVRLVGGGLGLQAGLTVLVLAPELYLPLRRLGAEYHASADGLAVADRILGLLEAPPAVRDEGTLAAPDPAVEVVRFERVSFRYPGRSEPRARRFRARASAGRSGGARRRERRGEEHPR